MDDRYIWVNRWDEFQSFQEKRGKPWAPPWVKLHTKILDNPEFLDLTPETRMVLVGIWALFARTHGTLTKDTRRLSRQLSQRVTERQLESLNHAGFITFCSGTVLEQFRAAFWNRSTLEESRTKQNRNSAVDPSRNGTPANEQHNDREEEEPPLPDFEHVLPDLNDWS